MAVFTFVKGTIQSHISLSFMTLFAMTTSIRAVSWAAERTSLILLHLSYSYSSMKHKCEINLKGAALCSHDKCAPVVFCKGRSRVLQVVTHDESGFAGGSSTAIRFSIKMPIIVFFYLCLEVNVLVNWSYINRTELNWKQCYTCTYTSGTLIWKKDN